MNISLLEKILSNPILWNASRYGLDIFWGLYKKRIKIIRDWRIIKEKSSVLDIGCGTGYYSKITDGEYLGIDLESKYINYCKKKYSKSNKKFKCIDVASLLNEKESFDIVLMVDVLHHIPDDLCKALLKKSSKLSKVYIINFEPVHEQDSFLGKWLVRQDRGDHIRKTNEFLKLYEEPGLEIIQKKNLVIGPLKSIVILSKPKKER